MKQIAFLGTAKLVMSGRLVVSGMLVMSGMLVLSGCRAPMPSCNLLAPYGPRCAPPPSTGAIGTGGTYYSPPAGSTTAPPIGTGFRPVSTSQPINKWSDLGDPMDETQSKVAGDLQWSPTRTETSPQPVTDLTDVDIALANQPSASRVIPASRVLEHRGPVRIVQPSATLAGSGTVLRGLPLNGTLVSRSPREFVPSGQVVDITEYRNGSSSQIVPAPTTAGASQGSSSADSGGWKSRT